MKILVVEDEKVAAKAVGIALDSARMVHEVAATGEEALEFATLYRFDVVIVDLNLPDMDGCELVRRLRAAKVDTPVVMLSARGAATDKVTALTSGADDYVTKPFNRAELVARLQAIVRRSRGHADSVIRSGRLAVNISARSVEIDGLPVHVTRKEYGILELLALRRSGSVSKQMIIEHLYNGPEEPEAKAIDVFVCRLRHKLTQLSGGERFIETVRGRGYTLREPGSPAAASVAPPPRQAEHRLAA